MSGPEDRGQHRQAAGAIARRLIRPSNKEIAATFADTEKTSRTRALSKKQFRARIDRMNADEERTFGQLLELRDRVTAIIAECNRVHDPVVALPSIAKIIHAPSRFPSRFPPRPSSS
jgi:hypothetical protein